MRINLTINSHIGKLTNQKLMHLIYIQADLCYIKNYQINFLCFFTLQIYISFDVLYPNYVIVFHMGEGTQPDAF